jgi:hypothetical protein
MFWFWALVVSVGFIGAVADVTLAHWSRTNQLFWWLAGAVGFLVFMTGLGLIIRQGAPHGYTLTIALVLAVLLNVAFVAAWEVYSGGSLSPLQWVGVMLAVGAVVCLEIGRS